MHIIIIGFGRQGSNLAQALLLQGHSVVVVDKEANAFEHLPSGFKGKTIVGIGFDQDVLREAGIERADGFAAVTSSDEANFIAARIAKQIFRVPKVVARLYDPGQAEIYSRLGLQTIAPIAWGSHRIMDLILMSQLEINCEFGAGNVELVSLEAPLLSVGRAIESLTMPGEFQVVAVTRGGKSFLPNQGTILQNGDLIHMVVLTSSATRLDLLVKSQAGG